MENHTDNSTTTPAPTPTPRMSLAMRIWWFGFAVWLVGAVIIGLSWFHIVTPQVGWIGFWISGVGFVVSGVAHFPSIVGRFERGNRR